MRSLHTLLLLLCGVLHLPHRGRGNALWKHLKFANITRLKLIMEQIFVMIITNMTSLFKISTYLLAHKILLIKSVMFSKLYLAVTKTSKCLPRRFSNNVVDIIRVLLQLFCQIYNNKIKRVSTCVSEKIMIRKIVLICIIISAAQPVHAETAVMHYGHFGGLSITCQRGELILIESERLGYSKDADCRPEAQCSVPYPLAKWYCRGRSTCGGMQVERRPLHKRTCGSDFTNCLRVEYQCISSKFSYVTFY